MLLWLPLGHRAVTVARINKRHLGTSEGGHKKRSIPPSEAREATMRTARGNSRGGGFGCCHRNSPFGGFDISQSKIRKAKFKAPSSEFSEGLPSRSEEGDPFSEGALQCCPEGATLICQKGTEMASQKASPRELVAPMNSLIQQVAPMTTPPSKGREGETTPNGGFGTTISRFSSKVACAPTCGRRPSGSKGFGRGLGPPLSNLKGVLTHLPPPKGGDPRPGKRRMPRWLRHRPVEELQEFRGFDNTRNLPRNPLERTAEQTLQKEFAFVSLLIVAHPPVAPLQVSVEVILDNFALQCCPSAELESGKAT
ncbi:hypothetical protein RRG08_003312 [Elysia crispata]|uniref:Uncharacterized protein n=1 Tax=Elysia crispata TaxID=231223 RepID=A0AAE1DLP3_9GAST|nr:hypothetical protein RRG08_003312 [Elysia crispata]